MARQPVPKPQTLNPKPLVPGAFAPLSFDTFEDDDDWKNYDEESEEDEARSVVKSLGLPTKRVEKSPLSRLHKMAMRNPKP